MVGLSYGEETTTIYWIISIEYRNVTERQTDGRTDNIAMSISRVSVLTRDNKSPRKYVILKLHWGNIFFYGPQAMRSITCRSWDYGVTLSRLRSVLCRIYFFRFARILHGFRRNSWEVINTMNRLNGYILGKIETGTWELRKERKFELTLIDFAAMSNRCWRLANEFTNIQWTIVDTSSR